MAFKPQTKQPTIVTYNPEKRELAYYAGGRWIGGLQGGIAERRFIALLDTGYTIVLTPNTK